MNLLRRIFRTLVVQPISRWVVRSVGMCGVGTPPTIDSHSEHGQRELVKVVHRTYVSNPMATLSPRWKVLSKLAKWKQKQLLLMLLTIWRVRPLTVWENDLLLEVLKLRKSQDHEIQIFYTILVNKSPTCKETFSTYRERIRAHNQDAYWALGLLCNGPGSPLRSSHPRRMVTLARSYAFLCKWILKTDLPATQFRTVEKRRKRGYTDHGSLGSRSYATKKLDEELAQMHYDNWPPWRKTVSLMGHEDFLRWCFENALI